MQKTSENERSMHGEPVRGRLGRGRGGLLGGVSRQARRRRKARKKDNSLKWTSRNKKGEEKWGLSQKKKKNHMSSTNG